MEGNQGRGALLDRGAYFCSFQLNDIEVAVGMVQDLAGKSVAIVGMARSGMAAAEFLWKRGARVTLSDNRPAAALESEIRFLNERNIAV